MVGDNFADILKSASLSSADYVHHTFVICPFLRFTQHFFEEAFTVCVFCQLEVVRAFIGSQCQQDHPFAFVSQERSHTVFTHIRSYGYRIYIQFFEESTGIHGRSVSDIPTFCIGNDELVRIVLLDIFYCLFKCDPAFNAHAFVKSEIGFVGDTQVGCCVDNRFIECKDRVFFFQQVFRNLLDISIKSYAKK